MIKQQNQKTKEKREPQVQKIDWGKIFEKSSKKWQKAEGKINQKEKKWKKNLRSSSDLSLKSGWQ